MADDASKQAQDARLLPTFRFLVDFGDDRKGQFQEVSGLDAQAQPMGDRHSDSEDFSKIKMPGLNKNNNITMKRGVFKNDSTFRDWFSDIKSDTRRRRTVVISLLDPTGAAICIWNLQNAWLVKITGPALNAKGNDVAIESIEIAHEGLTIANP